MNFFEKQADFGRTIFEINQNMFQELMSKNQENLQKYFEMNSEFGKKLPEVRDVTTFVELQREYGETLWNGVREGTEAQAEILRGAVEETGNAFRKAMTPSEA